MIKKLLRKIFRSLLSSVSAHPEIEGQDLIWTAANGDRYYTWKEQDLPQDRAVILQGKLAEMSFGISGEDVIKTLLEFQRQTFTLKPNASAIQAYINTFTRSLSNFQSRTANIIDGNLELTAALIMFRHEKEPIEYSDKWVEKKRKMWESDEKTKYFFLVLVIKRFRNLQNISPDSVRDNLQKHGAQV